MEKMERLINVEVTEHGTIIKEVKPVCCMTGFRLACWWSTWARGFAARFGWDRGNGAEHGGSPTWSCSRQAGTFFSAKSGHRFMRAGLSPL